MFGKFFASAFEGSMYGAGPDVFALWAYVISHTVNSRVEINPSMVAPQIGMSIDRVVAALRYLQKTDGESRNEEFDGRRMIKEGQFSYLIPSHRTYWGIKCSEDLRLYNAKKQREHREKQKLRVHGKSPGEVAEEKEMDVAPPKAGLAGGGEWKPATPSAEYVEALESVSGNTPDFAKCETAAEFLERQKRENEARAQAEELRRLTEGE